MLTGTLRNVGEKIKYLYEQVVTNVWVENDEAPRVAVGRKIIRAHEIIRNRKLIPN